VKVGVPKEIKDQEFRVALTPGGVRELVESGHEVCV
jgi:alanine dehydrogenase